MRNSLREGWQSRATLYTLEWAGMFLMGLAKNGAGFGIALGGK